MTQEDKELLLKDLCGRLPYGVKAKYYGAAEECECCDIIEGIYPMDNEVVIGQYALSVDNIKPYLFPLSSMTKEQKREYAHILVMSSNQLIGETTQDWFNKNHFDILSILENDQNRK
jgi:hypothetical protein